MKIHVIAAKFTDKETPWIVTGWDEWTIDENPSGWAEAIEKIEKAHPHADVRVGIVEVPDSFLFDLFKPVTAKGTIVHTPDDMQHPKSEGGIGA